MKIQKMLMAVSIPVFLFMTNASYAGNCSGPCIVSTIGTSGAGGGTGSELRLIDQTFGFPINDTVNGQDWSIKNVFENTANSRLTIGLVAGADPFIIEDDASSNVLVVDDNDRVGINTSGPGQELEIRSLNPTVRLNDRSTGAAGGFVDIELDVNRFFVENKTGFDAFVMETTGGSAQTNQIYLDSDGDVGIQVANPITDLHVGGSGNILLENGINDWALFTNSDGLFFRRGNNTVFGSIPFAIEHDAPNGSLRIIDDGKIGMGTPTPTAALHVRKNGAKLLLDEASATTAQRFMVEMKNKGGSGFLLTDTSQAAESQWQFSTQPNEAFTASFIGTGGPEMQVRKDGAVQFGPGNVVNFALTANGHMLLQNGSATATAHITSSSREVKKDFEKVDSKAILEKIKSLEITEWRYKNKDEKGRHIGPMAEDFYKLFKLGADDKHVVGTDMASIALIAAKELQAENEALKKQLEEKTMALESKLKTENEALQKRLTSLEKLVTNLASANGHLSLSGEKVATAK